MINCESINYYVNLRSNHSQVEQQDRLDKLINAVVSH